MCTKKKEDAVPTPVPGVESTLGNWKDPDEMDQEMGEKFLGSMAGKSSLCPWNLQQDLSTVFANICPMM